MYLLQVSKHGMKAAAIKVAVSSEDDGTDTDKRARRRRPAGECILHCNAVARCVSASCRLVKLSVDYIRSADFIFVYLAIKFQS